MGQFNLLMKDLENTEGSQKEEKLSIIISTARILGILQSDPDSWLGYQKLKTGMDVNKIEEMIEDTAEGTIWKSES